MLAYRITVPVGFSQFGHQSTARHTSVCRRVVAEGQYKTTKIVVWRENVQQMQKCVQVGYLETSSPEAMRNKVRGMVGKTILFSYFISNRLGAWGFHVAVQLMGKTSNNTWRTAAKERCTVARKLLKMKQQPIRTCMAVPDRLNNDSLTTEPGHSDANAARDAEKQRYMRTHVSVFRLPSGRGGPESLRSLEKPHYFSIVRLTWF